MQWDFLLFKTFLRLLIENLKWVNTFWVQIIERGGQDPHPFL